VGYLGVWARECAESGLAFSNAGFALLDADFRIESVELSGAGLESGIVGTWGGSGACLIACCVPLLEALEAGLVWPNIALGRGRYDSFACVGLEGGLGGGFLGLGSPRGS
jgi:hypothetical protein